MAGFDQTLTPFLWRAENLYPDREIVSRTHKGLERYTYREYGERTRQPANALADAGIGDGDRRPTRPHSTAAGFAPATS